jgi:hypothetical protein
LNEELDSFGFMTVFCPQCAVQITCKPLPEVA